MLRKEEAFDEDRFWNGQVKPAAVPTSSQEPAAANNKANATSIASLAASASANGVEDRAREVGRHQGARLYFLRSRLPL